MILFFLKIFFFKYLDEGQGYLLFLQGSSFDTGLLHPAQMKIQLRGELDGEESTLVDL